jgi:hypothetical protein
MALGRWLAAAWALAAAVPASAANFTYEDPQCADFTVTGTGPSYTLTCTFIATPACQLQAYPANPAAGTQVSLVASCTGSPFGWIFTVPTAGTTLIYTVLGGNAAGRGPVAAITVTWQ